MQIMYKCLFYFVLTPDIKSSSQKYQFICTQQLLLIFTLTLTFLEKEIQFNTASAMSWEKVRGHVIPSAAGLLPPPSPSIFCWSCTRKHVGLPVIVTAGAWPSVCYGLCCGLARKPSASASPSL